MAFANRAYADSTIESGVSRAELICLADLRYPSVRNATAWRLVAPAEFAQLSRGTIPPHRLLQRRANALRLHAGVSPDPALRHEYRLRTLVFPNINKRKRAASNSPRRHVVSVGCTNENRLAPPNKDEPKSETALCPILATARGNESPVAANFR